MHKRGLSILSLILFINIIAVLILRPICIGCPGENRLNLSSYRANMDTKNANNEFLILKNANDHSGMIIGSSPPANGDWKIQDQTVIIEGGSYIINGSILIEDNGTLILKDTKIYMNKPATGGYAIKVFSGGNLTVIGSLITTYVMARNFNIEVYSGGTFYSWKSEISYPDYIHIESNNVIINYSYIHHSYGWLYFYDTNCTLINNIFEKVGSYGIWLQKFYGIFHNNSVVDSYDSINLRESHAVKFTDIKIINCYYGIFVINCRDFTITKSEFRDSFLGLSIDEVNDSIVFNNTFINNKQALHLLKVRNITVRDNHFTQNDLSVQLLFSDNNTIINNRIFNSSEVGCMIEHSNNTILKYNNLTDCDRGSIISVSFDNTIVDNIFVKCGIELFLSYNNTIENNTVNGRPLVYLERESDLIINDAGQILILSCLNITVKDVDIYETSIGIEIHSSENITIINTTIRDCHAGIYVWESLNIEIQNNSILFGGDDGGLALIGSNNCKVFFNYIKNQSAEGICIERSANNTIMGNDLINNWYGIHLMNSTNNVIFLNKFINNHEQAVDDGINRFDNGSIGNYWSDYRGEDSNGDGIGDTPYYIDADSVDRYPLILDLEPPTFEEIIQEPQNPTCEDSVVIKVKISDASDISEVILSYCVSGIWTNVTMVYNPDNGYYEATIPAFPDGTKVDYKVYAKDINGNWAVSQTYTYTVGESTGGGVIPMQFVFTGIIITVSAGIVISTIQLLRKRRL
ncbi:MAG: NosD domain-containing protein [Candidatus Njordarchaeum guaymaensis]